jgi:hypothetical protein
MGRMRIKVSESRPGLHPHETVAVIATLTGPEELVVDERSGQMDSIDVGHPVALNGKNYLVELPSETSKGAWRVWVSEDTTLNEVREAAE